MLEANHWTSLDTNIPKRKTKIMGREIATERSTKSGQNTEEIYFSNWIHSDKLAFLVPVVWASNSRDTLKRINLQEDENENEVGGTPVVKSERLAEKKLPLPNESEATRCHPFLFMWKKSCHSWINATEE